MSDWKRIQVVLVLQTSSRRNKISCVRTLVSGYVSNLLRGHERGRQISFLTTMYSALHGLRSMIVRAKSNSSSIVLNDHQYTTSPARYTHQGLPLTKCPVPLKQRLYVIPSIPLHGFDWLVFIRVHTTVC